MPTREPPEPRFSYENWPGVVLGVVSEQAELCSQRSPKHKVIPAGPRAESPRLLGSALRPSWGSPPKEPVPLQEERGFG